MLGEAQRYGGMNSLSLFVLVDTGRFPLVLELNDAPNTEELAKAIMIYHLERPQDETTSWLKC